ncbi:MAG: nucleoside hydrolase [Oscillospiraceae bacterium]|jgi:hypothetical protein|nr:nucleoside hydrolase [Oscillospiraceae bacterium]
MIDNKFLIQQLKRPTGIVDAVLDTDTYNEIDDQYALAYFLLSKEVINPQAIYAAPFFNQRSESPADGMEKSYQEIKRVLKHCKKEKYNDVVFKGSQNYLLDEETPVLSDAAYDLVQRAKTYQPDKPLYVLAIGAITNIASALLLDPSIRERIVVVWLGGHIHSLPYLSKEFNMSQDVAAARVVFNSGVPFVQLPCMGVVSHLSTTEPELRHNIKGKSDLGDYLYDITCKVALEDGGNATWSRVIWDISTIAWLKGEDYVKDTIITTPIPNYDYGYSFDVNRHFMKVAYHVNRDVIFHDLFNTLTR